MRRGFVHHPLVAALDERPGRVARIRRLRGEREEQLDQAAVLSVVDQRVVEVKEEGEPSGGWRVAGGGSRVPAFQHRRQQALLVVEVSGESGGCDAHFFGYLAK